MWISQRAVEREHRLALRFRGAIGIISILRLQRLQRQKYKNEFRTVTFHDFTY